jgi:alanine-synthesizing transaminase
MSNPGKTSSRQGVFEKSDKLQGVCYEIRGPVLDQATRMEEEGQRILKLNIGNPAAFDLLTPDEILTDVIHMLPESQGYCESKGLYSARKAVMQRCQQQGIHSVQVSDIYLGNGCSELIMMAMQALLNNDDEMLIPTPDYPLWTAATAVSGGKPVHYACDEAAEWNPDLDDIRKKITPRTRGIVVINPNNPTGAVYSKEVLEGIVELARQHKLIIFADEIYDHILYDGAIHTPMARIAPDVLVVSFNGLSKSHRLAGFRSGWMYLSGPKQQAQGYIQGLDILASMRLCANVPAQHAIQTALGGHQSINDLVAPGGRLYEQRQVAWEMLNKIPGVSCVKPKGAIYLFPKLDSKKYPIKDDEQLVLDFLIQKKILLVQGTGFNHTDKQHLRVVFLPRVDDLSYAMEAFGDFLSTYKQ